MVVFEFSDDYFKDEIRCEFEVSSIMKRAWAAQLCVLEDFDKVCVKYGLKWYAFCGTLLGCVRHEGFIPWDDDIDICMMRSDYRKLISVIDKELPNNHIRYESKLDGDFDFDFDGIMRINSDDYINLEGERFEHYFEFPYVAGLDVYPMDFIPRNSDDRNLMITLHKIINAAILQYKIIYWPTKKGVQERLNLSKEELEENLQEIENLTNIRIDRNDDVVHKLTQIMTAIDSMYTEDESDDVACMFHLNQDFNYMLFPKKDFEKAVEKPFETGTIYIPSGYDDILARNFGANYMTPIKAITHNYPYFRREEMILYNYILTDESARSKVKKEYFYHIAMDDDNIKKKLDEML